MWVSSEFRSLHYKTPKSGMTSIELSSLRKVKCFKDRFLVLTDDNAERFAFVLSDKDKAEVWVTGLTMLVSFDCSVCPSLSVMRKERREARGKKLDKAGFADRSTSFLRSHR